MPAQRMCAGALPEVPHFSAEAYRRAVDVNPRDYRAWYGLGQTYELVNMPYYALYYFRRYSGSRAESVLITCKCLIRLGTGARAQRPMHNALQQAGLQPVQ